MNRTILMLENRDDFKCIYGLNQNLYLGTDIIIKSSIDSALQYIDENNPDLIFIDNKGFARDVAFGIWQELKTLNKKIPLFIIGKTKVPNEEAKRYGLEMDISTILKDMASAMGVTAKDMASTSVPDYYPLPMDFIVPGFGTSVELFLKDGEQYEIVLWPNSIIMKDFLIELKESDRFQLYVKKEVRLKFVNNITSWITQKLSDPTLSNTEKVNFSSQAYTMVVEQAKELGISETTLEVAKASMDTMAQISQSISKLDDLLKKLIESSASYRYKHSLLSSFIGSHIIAHMKWGNSEQQNKLAFVAFFHDITLPKDEFAKIKSNEELDALRLPKKEHERILYHAAHAALLVANHHGIPIGADTIIKQHHGAKNGNTLSDVSLTISPLAVVFMLAHEWAEMALEKEETGVAISKEAAIDKLSKIYNYPNFKKVLPILEKLNI